MINRQAKAKGVKDQIDGEPLTWDRNMAEEQPARAIDKFLIPLESELRPTSLKALAEKKRQKGSGNVNTSSFLMTREVL